MNNRLRILIGIIFYPRGGSAQVARYLSRALMAKGHDVLLLTGSIEGHPGEARASRFYDGIKLHVIDYSEALAAFENGEDPIGETLTTPLHPSYEDKPGEPDRVFYKVNPCQHENLQRCWEKHFREIKNEFRPDIMQLFHLSYMQLAAHGVCSETTPIMTHLHGTEMKMVQNLNSLAGEGVEHCRKIMEQGMKVSQGFITISEDNTKRCQELFHVPPEKISMIENGVDTKIFCPRQWTNNKKLEYLQKILVNNPAGWNESGEIGSIRYNEKELERFVVPGGELKPLLMFVGRFLDFKRVPLLLKAIDRVNSRFAGDPPFNLLLWGGKPGEYEGEHPHTVAKGLKLNNVFFCGWLPHADLIEGLNLADVFVAPSYYEPFGQVYLEAMAYGIPVIGTKSGGPLSFVQDVGDTANGWLAEVDDVESLAEIIYQSLTGEDERKRRGANARKLILEKYSWSTMADKFVEAYRSVL